MVRSRERVYSQGSQVKRWENKSQITSLKSGCLFLLTNPRGSSEREAESRESPAGQEVHGTFGTENLIAINLWVSSSTLYYVFVEYVVFHVFMPWRETMPGRRKLAFTKCLHYVRLGTCTYGNSLNL